MTRPLAIPTYSTGTAAVSSGGEVTGTGTNFLSPDGSANWTIAVGDIFFCGGAFAIIDAVNTATDLALAGWAGGTIAPGSSFTIFRYSGLPNTAVVGLVQQLINLLQTNSPEEFLSGSGFTPGTTTTLTLSVAPLSANMVSVYFNGVRQPKSTWSLSGNAITFGAAIPSDITIVAVTLNN